MERPLPNSEILAENIFSIPSHPVHIHDARGELQLGETCSSTIGTAGVILNDPIDFGSFWQIGYARCSNPVCHFSVPLTQNQQGEISAGFTAHAGFTINSI